MIFDWCSCYSWWRHQTLNISKQQVSVASSSLHTQLEEYKSLRKRIPQTLSIDGDDGDGDGDWKGKRCFQKMKMMDMREWFSMPKQERRWSPVSPRQTSEWLKCSTLSLGCSYQDLIQTKPINRNSMNSLLPLQRDYLAKFFSSLSVWANAMVHSIALVMNYSIY